MTEEKTCPCDSCVDCSCDPAVCKCDCHQQEDGAKDLDCLNA